MNTSTNNYLLTDSNPRPALALRLTRWFVLLLLAMAFDSAANAQLAVVNGNFSNVTGLTYSGGWYGGTSIPVGWTAPYFSGGNDPYMVYNPSSGNYYFNMSTTGDSLQQTVGTVSNNTPVILTFDSSTVFQGGTSLEAFILDSSYNVLASNTFSSGLGQKLMATNVPAGTTVQIYFDDIVNDVGLANVSVQSFNATTPPQITQQPAPTNYVRPPPDDELTNASLSVAALGVLPLSYQWLSDGVPIAGATNATLATGNGGSYTVVVTGANSLSVTSSVAQVIQAPQLGVINGTFSDLTGMTSIGGGWYGYAVPHEWAMTDTPSEYEVYNTAGGFTCNVDNLGFVTQYVGMLTNTGNVILSFDNNAVFGDSQLGVAILSSSNLSYTVLVQNNFSTGLGQQLVASNVPAGTDITLEFWAAADNPGLANIVINPATVTVASSLNPSTYGNSVTLTATATAPAGTPTGTITFKEGTTILGTSTLSSGVATLTTTGLLAVGSPQTITAVYSGDNYFGTGTGTLAGGQTVNPMVVTLGGSMTYDGEANITGANLTVASNLDGANLTLAGALSLTGGGVGSQSIVFQQNTTPALVQSAVGNSGSSASTTIPVTLGTAPVNGDTLIAVISTRGTVLDEVTGITQTGATWTRAVASAADSHGTTTEIWYAPNVSSAGTSVTINQASLESAAVIMEYSGVLTASPLDQTKSNTGGSSTSATTGTTTASTQATELWIGGIGLVNSGYTLTSPLSSFTAVANTASTSATAANNAVVYALAYTATAAAAASSGGTVSTASYWSGAIATFKQAGVTLGGSAAGNYTLTGTTGGSVTVTPKALTMSGLTVPSSKPYDGTTTATVSGTPTLATAEAVGTGTSSDGKPYTGDSVSITGTATGTYNSPNVGATTVTYGGLSLTGAQEGNYSLTIQSPASATITPRVVTLSGSGVYNGAATMPSANLSILNDVDGANLTLSGGAALAAKGVGSEAIVSYTTPVLVQSAVGNSGSSASTTIPVTLGTAPANGDTLIAVISTRGTVLDEVTGITQTGATWTRAVASAADSHGTTTEIWYAPNVSSAGTSVTINQASLESAAVIMEYSGVLTASPLDQTKSTTGGSSASATTGTTTATTQAAELWIGGIGLVNSGYTLASPLNSFTAVANTASTSATAANNAVVYALAYTASTAATASSGGTVSTASYWSGAIATFKAGEAGSLTLGGSAAPNYTVNGASGSVTVTSKALTMSGLTVPPSKLYDGTTTAMVSGTPVLATVEAAGTGSTNDGAPYTGDTVSITGTPTGTYDSPNVATASSVTFGGLSLMGAQAGNYSLTMQSPESAIITPLPVILTGTEAYSGNASAPAAILSVANLISPDTSATVNVNTGGGVVTLASASAGSEAITGGIGSLTLTQPAANYTLAGATGSVTITGGSNPPFSFTNSTSIQVVGGVTNLVVTWQSVSGTSYNVLTNSLYQPLPGSWADVGSASTPASPVTASGPTTTVSIPVSGATNLFVIIKQ